MKQKTLETLIKILELYKINHNTVELETWGKDIIILKLKNEIEVLWITKEIEEMKLNNIEVKIENDNTFWKIIKIIVN